jgi:PAS domain S-box-containing protein
VQTGSDPSWRAYSIAIAAVAAATGLRWLLDPALGDALPYATYLFAVASVAWWCGRGPSIVALILGGACGACFFSPLRHTHLDGVPTAPQFAAAAFYLALGASSIVACQIARRTRQRLSALLLDKMRGEETTARLAAIVTSSDDAIVSKDLHGTIMTWNRGAERLFGYTEDEAVGMPVTMLIPEDHVDEEPEILRRIARGEVIDHYETVRRRKDGRLVDVSLTVSPLRNAAGEVIGASKIARDISERGKAERSNARLAAIVEFSDDAIISKDLSSIIMSWNSGAERLFGYTAQEAIGQPVTMLMPPERFNEEPNILGRIKRGEVIDHYETVRRRKDGSLVDISLTVSPIRNAAGEVVGASKVARDITANKQIEQALRESEKHARAALIQAEDAARTKDEFLALLSHELRTPMSAIVGWATMLRTGMPAEETKRGIEVIERNARLQSQIIEDLLDMSRIISGKFRLDVQSVEVELLVGAAVDGVRLAAEAKGVQLNVILDPRVGEIRGDPNRLQQVFFNLLTNATKFTPRGGRIQVTCQRVASHVEVTVSDTGAGINPEFLPHVFERFQQQDGKITRAHQGLGLGLAIVKHLVEMHGGTVQAASGGEGKGATFTIQLPTSIALTPRSSSDTEEQRDHPRAERWMDAQHARKIDAKALAGLTVMVTDDEADAREMLRKMLESRGARVLVCGSALDTIDRLQRHHPNVLLCDIGMPGIDGYELIHRVRAFTPDRGGATPAIALTAFARSEDRTRSLLAGFQMHLSKPVEADELVASIRRVAAIA